MQLLLAGALRRPRRSRARVTSHTLIATISVLPSPSCGLRKNFCFCKCVLLLLADGSQVGDEGCRTIAEAEWHLIKLLSLGKSHWTKITTASGPRGV
jgi:hypothetical protein